MATKDDCVNQLVDDGRNANNGSKMHTSLNCGTGRGQNGDLWGCNPSANKMGGLVACYPHCCWWFLVDKQIHEKRIKMAITMGNVHPNNWWLIIGVQLSSLWHYETSTGVHRYSIGLQGVDRGQSLTKTFTGQQRVDKKIESSNEMLHPVFSKPCSRLVMWIEDEQTLIDWGIPWQAKRYIGVSIDGGPSVR